MPWFAISSEFHDHPSTAGLPADAVALWTLAGSWASRHTAGTVPKGLVSRMGFGPRAAVALIDAGLWTDAGDCYSFALEGELWRIVEARGSLPRREVFERDGWLCAYCRAAVSMESGHVDHVIPRSRGGSDELGNLTAACAPCNLSKGARTPSEWRN